MQGEVVPGDFKQALVKQTLCKNYLNNYRTICYISFLSKTLEEEVVNRLREPIYKHHFSYINNNYNYN